MEDTNRFGFSVRLSRGGDFSFRDTFTAKDKEDAERKIAAWARYHSFDHDSVRLAPVPEYAQDWTNADYMERF